MRWQVNNKNPTSGNTAIPDILYVKEKTYAVRTC